MNEEKRTRRRGSGIYSIVKVFVAYVTLPSVCWEEKKKGLEKTTRRRRK